jgi:hypothetical protein
LYPDEVPLIFP